MGDLQAFMAGLVFADIDGGLFPISRKGSGLLFGIWSSGASVNGWRRRASRSSSSRIAGSSDSWQDHYAVLGLSSHASSSEIKRAYRLLALKYHPDVSNDLQAAEVFKSIRLAYEVLSNEASRTKYDNALQLQELRKPWGRNGADNLEFDERLRAYQWNELRQRKWNERPKRSSHNADKSSTYGETNVYDEEGDERGSFSEVLWFAFFALFFMKTLGSQVSLTICGLTALLDDKLDSGYKMGYVVAWAMGGRGGIFVTLCLSFASWLCGKCSSSLIVLVVVAMWVGVNIAKFAPIPQGALLTLLYMSLKLQLKLNEEAAVH